MKSPVVSKGIVVMLDALGARDMTIDDAKSFLQNRDKMMDLLESAAKSVVTEPLEKKGKAVEKPKVITFGDTFILSWAMTDDPSMFLPIMSNWVVPIICVGMDLGFLLRGAISFGEYILDGATVLGPAIRDAVSWYEQAEWIGIIATPECGVRISLMKEKLKEPNDISEWFVKYPVPIKGGKTLDLWTLPWPKHIIDQAPSVVGKPGREYFLSLLSRFPIPFGVETKFRNTEVFFNSFEQG